MTSSVELRTSRYTQGGLTEVGPIGLEWWDKYNFPSDTSDLQVIVEERYKNRIDKIAEDFYQEPRLWWVIAQYNNILDPYSELTVGRVLYLPTMDRLQLFMTQRVGGIASTRTVETLLKPVVL